MKRASGSRGAPLNRLRFLMLGCLFQTAPAGAVYLTSLVYDIMPDEQFTARIVSNDTERANLYRLKIYKIDKPGRGGEHVQSNLNGEVLFTPLKFLLERGGREYFKLHYRGPEDNTERYYRVVFREIPIRLYPLQDTQKNINAVPVTAVSSVLIVRPRKMHFAYSVDENSHRVENEGNTYFRLIVHNGCEGDDESSRQLYLLPGEVFFDPIINAKNKKIIVGPSGYTRLGKACFETEL